VEGVWRVPTRIASLLPSATEIVCSLGRTELLVGVSHDCNFPPEIVGRPVLTEPGPGIEQDAEDTDDAIGHLVRRSLSALRIREEALRAARPDLIVTQDRCEVCQISIAELTEAVRAWLDSEVEIVSLKPSRLEAVFAGVLRVASTIRRESQGRVLVNNMREQLSEIRQRAARARNRPRVACIQWVEPLMLAGNWIPDLVELCGGEYGLLEPGKPSTVIEWSDLLSYQPEALIIIPCGVTVRETHHNWWPMMTGRPEWAELTAVRNKRVYSADADAYLNRPGPRLVDGALLLAGLIQPSFFASRIPPGSYEHVI
jgi:iron complex transport system substrate-binding protein